MQQWGFSQITPTNDALGAGAGSGTTETSNVNKETKKQKLEEFKATLPDVEAWRKTLINLQFFALCPNGKRLPVKSICEEYARDPTGLAYRTFEDRIVLVIQAIHPDLSEPYWNQAFYLSTGESSGMPGTWLPFNGILMKGDVARKIYAEKTTGKWRGLHEYRDRKTKNEKKIGSTAWFSKMNFAAPQDRPFGLSRWMNNDRIPLKEQMETEVWDRYSRFYLPEGEYLHYGSRFDRFGTISYALASHAIGGNLFENRYSDPKNEPYYPHVYHFFPSLNISNKNNRSSDRIFADILYINSPLQSCFLEMATTYPIAKPNIVNGYIDSHHAITYMNAFRQEKIFPPGLSYVQVPMPALGYAMPIDTYWYHLDGYVKNLWLEWKTGKITIAEIKGKFQHPEEETKKIIKEQREYYIMPDEPNIQYNLARERYTKKPQMLQYYGGRRNQTRQVKKRKNRTQKRKA